MAINLGNFGNVIAQPAQRTVQGADLTLGNALQAFGKMAGDIAIKEKREMDQAEGVRKQAEFEVEATTILNDTQERLRAGDIRADEAETYFGDRINELRNFKLQGVNTALKNQLGAAFEQGAARYRIRARDLQAGFVQEGQRVELMKTQEQLERLALTDPEGAKAQWNTVLDTIGVRVLDPTRVQELRQGFKERTTFNSIASRLESTNSIAGARQIEQQLTNPDFMPDLTPENRLQLRNAAESKRRELKAEADRIRRENEARANEQASLYVNIISSGLPLTPELRSEISRFTAGGGRAGRAVSQTLRTYDDVRTQQLKPISEQAAELQKLRQQVEAESNPQRRLELQNRLGTLSQSYQRGVERFRNDPLVAYAEVTGSQLPQIDLGSSQGFLASIKQRADFAASARGMTGQPVNLLTRSEAETFANTFKTMTTAQQADMLRSIRVAGGDSAAMSLAGSLNQVDRGLGFAAYHAAKRGQTNAGRQTASIILQGAKSEIRLKPTMLDTLRAELMKTTGTAFRGNSAAFDDYLHGAALAYRALSEDAGDFSGEFNRGRVRSAISISIGTSPVEVGGSTVIPPVGANTSRFVQQMQNGISRIGRDAFKLQGNALDQFTSNTTLRADANESYLLMNSDSNAVMVYPQGHPRAGQPIRLRAN